tara:strand:+ start:1528 stop:1932 length:405 start_codon:yes stop_codon:yes gene_type:complete
MAALGVMISVSNWISGAMILLGFLLSILVNNYDQTLESVSTKYVELVVSYTSVGSDKLSEPAMALPGHSLSEEYLVFLGLIVSSILPIAAAALAIFNRIRNGPSTHFVGILIVSALTSISILYVGYQGGILRYA